MYPRINELVRILHGHEISSFLVTNAQFPDAIRWVVILFLNSPFAFFYHFSCMSPFLLGGDFTRALHTRVFCLLYFCWGNKRLLLIACT